jgi:hypothetical protein
MVNPDTLLFKLGDLHVELNDANAMNDDFSVYWVVSNSAPSSVLRHYNQDFLGSPKMQSAPTGNQCCFVCDLYNEPCDRKSTVNSQHLKRKEALRAISKLVPRLAEDIQWQGWRSRIHLAFLETLALPSDSTTRKEGLGKIKKMKTWYVQREFLIPLQLAIWKNSCVFGGTIFVSRVAAMCLPSTKRYNVY